jgi:hypothetical protein
VHAQARLWGRRLLVHAAEQHKKGTGRPRDAQAAAWLGDGAPGPLTVSRTPGTPRRKPAAAAAYPAACSLRQEMKRMPQA